jgi:hypothetical protein
LEYFLGWSRLFFGHRSLFLSWIYAIAFRTGEKWHRMHGDCGNQWWFLLELFVYSSHLNWDNQAKILVGAGNRWGFYFCLVFPVSIGENGSDRGITGLMSLSFGGYRFQSNHSSQNGRDDTYKLLDLALHQAETYWLKGLSTNDNQECQYNSQKLRTDAGC